MPSPSTCKDVANRTGKAIRNPARTLLAHSRVFLTLLLGSQARRGGSHKAAPLGTICSTFNRLKAHRCHSTGASGTDPCSQVKPERTNIPTGPMGHLAVC